MRRGSLQYWPHRRAKKQMPRVRTWASSAEASFEGLVAYKVGMTHISMIDDTESTFKGQEVTKPVTILEIPKVHVYGLRFYKTIDNYRKAAGEVIVKEITAPVGIKNTKNTLDKLEGFKKDASIDDVTALLYLDASNLGFGNKRVMRFEIALGGKDVSDKIAFAEKWLGKEVKVHDVLKDGDFIDVKSISKGRGWAGVIKRFGVARLARKATNKIRHVGTLGPWHPAKVTYMVPQAGHMGYNFRTEINKRVLKVGNGAEANTVNVSGGYVNYGNVKNDFIILEGSIPGTSKRLVRFRKSVRNKSPIKKPEIRYVSLTSKQGA